MGILSYGVTKNRKHELKIEPGQTKIELKNLTPNQKHYFSNNLLLG